jgi:hypothetical protein
VRLKEVGSRVGRLRIIVSDVSHQGSMKPVAVATAVSHIISVSKPASMKAFKYTVTADSFAEDSDSVQGQ